MNSPITTAAAETPAATASNAPAYPLVEAVELHRWTDCGGFNRLSAAEKIAVWMGASEPLRHVLWRMLNEIERVELFRFGGPWFAYTLARLWRGRVVRHVGETGEDRAAFVESLGSGDQIAFWGLLNNNERRAAFEYPADAVDLFAGLGRYDRLVQWKHLSPEQRQGLWDALPEDGRAALVADLDWLRATLENIELPPADESLLPPRTRRQQAFDAAFDCLAEGAEFVTLAGLADAIGITTRQARNQAVAFGYKIRRGDVLRGGK